MVILREMWDNILFTFNNIAEFTQFALGFLWTILAIHSLLSIITNAKSIGSGLTSLINFVFFSIYSNVRKSQAKKEVTATRMSKIGYFLNDMVIDLRLKQVGIDVTLAVMYFLVINIGVALIVSLVLVGGAWGIFLTYPVTALGLFVFFYNKAAKNKLVRMMELLEAENIICNGIDKGFITSLTENIDTIPEGLRPAYQDYIMSNTVLGRHHSESLKNLKQVIGYESVDTLEKIENFIDNETVGSAGVFREVVQLNNTKIELRNHLERQFGMIKTDFNNSLVVIAIGVIGVNVIYENVRYFYLENLLGNMVILLNIVIVMAVFGYITSLQARSF